MADKSINPTQGQETAIMPRYSFHWREWMGRKVIQLVNINPLQPENRFEDGINSQGSLKTGVGLND